MKIVELEVAGAFAVDAESFADARGSFTRSYCTDELAALGIEFPVAQANLSYNARRGTLRGMHLQLPPHEELKLVRCVRGSVFDVAVDLRAGSPTQLQWVGRELSADGREALLIPTGAAHGFVTLEDETEVEYLVSAPHAPTAGVGFRWDDPTVAIDWPVEPSVIIERDATYPDLDVDRIRVEGPSALQVPA